MLVVAGAIDAIPILEQIMCCFSGIVEHVADTKIFARNAGNGRQFLVYEMKFETKADVAMILPLPVPPNSMEGDVRFLDFKEYPHFFQDMERGFPIPLTPTNKGGFGGGAGGFVDRAPLKVAVVGEFEASYIPTVADFDRLDARFRLPGDTWQKDLPQYRDWGFAVFKLKPGHGKAHPMAFDFPRKLKNQMFFPTVHIHDGEIHEKATFDHVLYLQVTNQQPQKLFGWRESPQPATKFMKINKCQSVVSGAGHVYRQEVKGEQPNRDVLV